MTTADKLGPYARATAISVRHSTHHMFREKRSRVVLPKSYAWTYALLAKGADALHWACTAANPVCHAQAIWRLPFCKPCTIKSGMGLQTCQH